MTDAEFIAWLTNTPAADRNVLVEAVASVAGVETTRYLARRLYVTGPADTPANTAYDDGIIVGSVTVSERLSLDGSPALAFGDIEILNVGGTLDSWLDDVWAGRDIAVYVGDNRWPRADFRLVFQGVIEDIGSRNRDRLNLKVRDKLQRLNTAVTDTTLGGATANADRVLPVTLGEVHNIEPLLVDPALLKYKVHAGAIESIIEVRDNGVPVDVTPTVADGTFVLDQQNFGQVTASVQGDKPAAYANTVAALVRRLATGYGSDPLDDITEVDDAVFDAFDAAHTQPVGLHLPDRANVLAAAQQLAASLGAQVIMSALGKLRIVQIALPPSGTPTEVTGAAMVEDSLEVAECLPVRAAVKLAYCQNYSEQPGLQTGLPSEHLDLFAQRWLTVSATDSAVATAYRLSEAAQPEETCLLVTADAQAEATRRLNLWKTPRRIYRYTGLPELMLEELGGGQTITHSRFGMGSGKTGQVVGLVKDWTAASVVVEVLA